MIAALVVLIAVRLPVALAMGLTGAGGYVALAGWAPLSGYLKTAMVDKFVSYDLAIIPLFILMGQLATRSGVSRSIFDACNAWLGHRRGGLAMASVAGCAAFGAICGSSIATATTMGQVALPEMRRHGTSAALSAGTLAAGGTLGILIPPSIILVIYAVLTEQNIVKLFLAATVPGLLAVLGFMV
ncbi:MAG TPA: TRAP transporter large permease subunit, partial [Alphaproteobacteria bacterium]